MNNERTMKTPFSNLFAKRNKSSKPYLMFSELLDNSIGSWLTSDLKRDLKITLEIDNFNQEIRCTDNAGGMSAEELLDSVELNREKPGNVINMFGVGMKNAAFWFGKDLIIETHNGIESNRTSVALSKVENLNDPIVWRIEKPILGRDHQGTDIIIKNVYSDRLTSHKEIVDTISILETKYKKFLIGGKNGQVYIDIIWIDESGEEKGWELEGEPTKAQVIPKDRISNFISSLDRNFKGEAILKGIKNQAIEKAKSGLPLQFNFTIKILDKPVEFTFGVLEQPKIAGKDSKEFKANYGITAYQKDRAIRMSGVNPLEFPKQDYTRTNIKRIFGFCELGEVFKPDDNKQDFNFGQDREAFFSQLANMGKDLIQLADAVFDAIAIKEKVRAGVSVSSGEKIKVAMQSKTTSRLFLNTIKDTTSSWKFTAKNGSEWSVLLKEISVELEDDVNFFVNARTQKENVIEITYNVNHPIWKPLVNDGNVIDIKTVTYPLIVIMGLAKIGIENHLLKEWLSVDDEINYLEMINELAKIGLTF